MSEKVNQSSYKKLFSNTIIFAIGSFSSKVLVLLLVKVYTTYLSPEEMGINDVITQIANWLQPLVTLTVSEAIIRFGLDKAYNKIRVFTLGNIICFAGLAVLGVILPIVAISGVADKYLSGYSVLLYVYIFSSSLKLVYSTFVRALERVKLFAINGILTTFFTLAGTLLFMIGFKMGNTGYLLSIIVSDLISVVFLTFTAKLWRYLDFKRIDRELLHTMLQYSIPLIPAQILWLITNSSDSFMTTHYLGSEANGILSASYKIPNLVATVYLMFGQAWNMSAILENDSEDRDKFYTNVFNLNQCLLYILAAGCLMIVQPLTSIWLGESFQESVRYSPILIYSSIFSCFTTFLGSIYLASKETKRSMITSLFSGIINVGLNIILIPRIGLYGPPISTVASYLAVFIIRGYDSRKLVPFDLKIKKIVINNIILAAMVVINITQPFVKSKALSFALLPVLFIVITIINFGSLWSIVKKMIPARILNIAEKMGTKRLIFLAAAALVFILMCYITKGIILFAIFIPVLVMGIFKGQKKLVYISVIGIVIADILYGNFGTGMIMLAA
ncbi:MAG: polysaccharide biosynthesis C-terminal domain-containing protein, partial [Ruminococcus sp.]|nr:polysaccharide biosynthesis C-terminal domain-containing protein [Ruminococcus sp.]